MVGSLIVRLLKSSNIKIKLNKEDHSNSSLNEIKIIEIKLCKNDFFNLKYKKLFIKIKKWTQTEFWKHNLK